MKFFSKVMWMSRQKPADQPKPKDEQKSPLDGLLEDPKPADHGVASLDKALLACDELAGFVMACCMVRPDGIHSLAPSSVKKKLKDKKVIIGGTAIELGDHFSVPNGRVIAGPLLQTLAAESILQGRTLRWTSDVVTLAGLCVISLIMMLSWRRLGAGMRVIVLVAMAVGFFLIALRDFQKF